MVCNGQLAYRTNKVYYYVLLGASLTRGIFSQHSLEFLKTSCSSAPLAVHSSGIFTVVTELVNARMDQTKRGVKMVSALSEEEKARD